MPEEILQVDTDKLIDILSEASRGRFNKEKTETLKAAAKDSFGVLLSSDSTFFMLKQFVEQIKFLEDQFKELEDMIAVCLALFKTPPLPEWAIF